MASYDNKLLDGEHLVYYTQKVKTELAGKQPTIDSSHKLDYSLLDNTPTIPDELADLTADSTHRVVTDAQISTWDGKQNAIADLSDIRSGAAAGATALQSSDLIEGTGIDISVDSQGQVTISNTNSAAVWGNITGTLSNQTDLSNALGGKQDTVVFNTAYDASTNKAATMTDITQAISGLTGFHFEIVQALPVTGEGNVIYLVLKSTSETGNIYTEYAWINNAWEQLGDTQLSIEVLSNSDIDSIWAAATPSNS